MDALLDTSALSRLREALASAGYTSQGIKDHLGEDATALCAAAGYRGVGTVERCDDASQHRRHEHRVRHRFPSRRLDPLLRVERVEVHDPPTEVEVRQQVHDTGDVVLTYFRAKPGYVEKLLPVGSKSPTGDGKYGHADLAGTTQGLVQQSISFLATLLRF